MAYHVDGVGILQEKLLLLIPELSPRLAGESGQLKFWQELQKLQAHHSPHQQGTPTLE